ncbi:DUF6716 putative glycosyltransferase [Pseudokineococcus marinus]|uniref:Uncharacterized protein n=1 Tax=Pseudokineococcus marinus TaxID=351215 RepID=A0A849BRG7_9ACTN|nr:DUF6716 putative glycosyltransferase [Pseudokineococcus marinus]NNH23973.1 hypothetical protein [Pseudokineococcus marinus]
MDATTTTAPDDGGAPARPAARTRTAVLVAAFDSQLKWVGRVQEALEARGIACRTIVPSDVRHAISPAQQAEYAHSSAVLEEAPWDEVVAASLDADVVALALSGPFVERFTQDLVSRGGDRLPVVVCGWVGVIIEKLVAGYLDRAAADVIAVNSGEDLERFRRTAAALGLDDSNLLLSGLPLLGSAAAPRRTTGAPRTVLFADQPTVPERRAERLYVYDRLVRYAVRHPDRQVRLKPRHRPGEDTFHRMAHHPERLLAGRDLPPNFHVDYTPISAQLDEVDLLLTVSSTAALESVGAGVTTALVSDLGVREQLGNQVFVSSGLLRTFDDLEADDLPEPDRAWLDGYFFGEPGTTPAERVARRVEELLEHPERRVLPSVASSSYFAARSAYLTATAALAGAPGARRGPGRWRAVRALKTRAYRWAPGTAQRAEDALARVLR